MPRRKQLPTRTSYVSFRVSGIEKKAIELAAKRVNLSTSSFARKAVFDKKVTLRFSPEELQAYQDLHKFHRNFKSISNLIKSDRFNKNDRILEDLEFVITQLNEHLKRFEQ
ncbi:plasmid mobilization protein [Mangrovibacterium diazotrophicum]|uniref:Mobilization protein n=1 Tax=Mangrovibacterium diazotrophicum TaxID=1261403 RepID=A0A419WB20_9BACT|nr:hypothetical protein [Mangrovibacterium diazotrophicum]RKD92647.1 hypothetical protein BC643_3022 [Mangrovibacterium diazotrophicum]